MMKQILLTFILLSNLYQVKAQNLDNVKQTFKLIQLEGIWQNKIDTINYKIIKGNRFLRIVNSSDDILLRIDKCGFLSKKDTTVIHLRGSGNPVDDKFYLGNDYLFDFSFQEGQSLVDMMELENTNIFVYRRIDQLPANLVRNLLKIKHETKRDYLKEFLAMTFKKVITRKAIVFSNLFHAQNIYLIQGDEVELLERKGNWLRIRYYGLKNIEGWIKSSVVNE